MRLTTLLDILWASVMTHYVSDSFSDRGGIVLVAPPGQLKTSMLAAVAQLPGVISYSDLTVVGLVEARDLIVSGKMHTVVLYDLQKLYERRADTAANIIGSLRALAGEGFSSAAWEKQSKQAVQMTARALVLAATTIKNYSQHLPEWEESGFNRRFIFSVFRMRDPEVVLDRVLRGKPIKLRYHGLWPWPGLRIPMRCTEKDRRTIRSLLGRQADAIPALLLKRILSVLRWRAAELGRRDNSLELVEEFGESMHGEGAVLEVDNVQNGGQKGHRRKQK